MKKHLLTVVLLAAAGVFTSAAASAAEGKAPAVTSQARVAGGERVSLVASRLTAEQWSAQRPKFRSLRPKARSNIE